MAKIDFRLVPNQNPDVLLKRLKEHLVDKGFGDIEVRVIGSSYPSRTPVKAKIVGVARKAAERVYRVKPVIYPNSAGSAPDYVFTKILGLDSIWTGSSPSFSNIHAPNEFTTVEAYMKGIAYTAAIMEELVDQDAEYMKNTPYNTAVGRIDELWAARNMILTYKQMKRKDML